MKINISGPSITQKEIDYVNDAITNGWYDNANEYINKFEKTFSEYLDVKYAISLPSCTSGIHLALSALGISKGDEVIVPDITWIASAAPISYVDATPVFADIDEKTWCISADSFENLITDKTKAVIVVDLYGNIQDMNRIKTIAKEHNITIIEDAAEAIGSEYKYKDSLSYKKAGSLGDIGVFSFHGTKTMTTGEGGMLVTNNKDIYDRCIILRDHGRVAGDKLFWNREIGYKYKMSNLQAALGLAQIERINELVDNKRQIFNWYKEELNDLLINNMITINYEDCNTKNSYWMVTIIINPTLDIEKESIIYEMKKYDIDCRPFFYPLTLLPAYSELDIKKYQELNKVSYELSPYGINLPSGQNMTEEKVTHVCDNLRKVIKELLVKK